MSDHAAGGVVRARAVRHVSTGGHGEEHRTAVRASQRLRIVLAAATCARSVGLQELKVSEIVAASGVSRRSFYEVFESREQCLIAAFEEGLRRGSDAVLPAFHAQDNWSDAVRAGLAALLRFIEEQPLLAGYCLLDAPSVGALVLRRRAQVTAALARAIDAGRVERPERRGTTTTTAEVLVSGALAVLHDRLLADAHASVTSLQGELMAAIVRPYLGAEAAEAELRSQPRAQERQARRVPDPLAGLRIRWTYRTIAVIRAVAAHPGASNRAIGQAAGVSDQAQISRLLARLQDLGLIENDGGPASAGLANAWHLTRSGAEVAAQLPRVCTR